MHRIQERRRHVRMVLDCPVVFRDQAGRILLRGCATDVSASGIRAVGPGRSTVREDQTVWVELGVPNLRRSGPRVRFVKMRGQVRRTTEMGDRKSAVIVFDSNFSRNMLAAV